MNLDLQINLNASKLRITILAEWQNQKMNCELYSNKGSLVKRINTANTNQTESLLVRELMRALYIIKVIMIRHRLFKHRHAAFRRNFPGFLRNFYSNLLPMYLYWDFLFRWRMARSPGNEQTPCNNISKPSQAFKMWKFRII